MFAMSSKSNEDEACPFELIDELKFGEKLMRKQMRTKFISLLAFKIVKLHNHWWKIEKYLALNLQ